MEPKALFHFREEGVPMGITHRDWLAGLAMQGELASQSPSSEWHKPNKLVKRVYMFADAMIAESNK